jgi:hypothetical protein
MARKKDPPGIKTYYETLRKIFELQSEILTGVLPHYGERGRNDEERFRDFLSKVLPRKFSVGSGFLVCSEPSIPYSSQTDVVIFDEIQNSPLHGELSSFIYPVEMVYGVIEVKGLLQRKDLKKILIDIEKIRNMEQHKWYINYGAKPKDPPKPDELVVDPHEFQIKLTPRAFLFAYDQRGWNKLGDFVESLKKALSENPNAHLHGVAVLSKNWFASQEAYAATGVKIHGSVDNCLLQFINKLIHSIASMPMYQMSVDRYLNFRSKHT